MKVLNSCMGGNSANGDFLRPICRKLGLDYVVMSEWSEHDIRWKEDTWLEELSKADVVVCPQNIKTQPAKSNNRATQAMALGKPVVCSRLEAYEEAISSGQNGFICDTEAQWESALVALMEPDARKVIGERAAASVQAAYSIAAVGKLWSSLVNDLSLENCSPPKVDIIIPTWNNLKYLKTCIESIRKNTDWPHNIIVVSSGSDGTADWIRQQPDVISVISETRMHFSQANNAGLKIAKEKYVCLLNDDTVVGIGWLGALMHEAMKPGVGAVGPYSNCDRGWLHDEAIRVEGVDLVTNMKLEEVDGILRQIWKYRHAKEVYERNWLAFYCTLMPRAAVDKVGLLDEGFLSGDEDLDYCTRLKQAGYRMLSTYDSWVFHFGGKTRKAAEDVNHALHHEEDRKNHEYFIRKWGKSPGDPSFRNLLQAKAHGEVKSPEIPRVRGQKKLFAIYTGQGWERWSPKSIDDGGIGGSETATVYTAREFAKKGWRSVVFGDCEGQEGIYDGVEYIHYQKFNEFAKRAHFDFFVSSRRVDVFQQPIEADRKAVVVHDIWLSPDQDLPLQNVNVDKYFTLSPWHRDFFLKHHRNADPEKVAISRDGVDLSRFQKKFQKEQGRMVYSSSPDRGLDVLLDCLPEIRKAVPGASVHVFYGFSNWEMIIRQRGRAGEIEWMESIKARLDDPGVVYRGRVGQKKLAKEMLRSEIWAYPTGFTETFCMTAAEQMAAGNPAVTSDLAALSTTVGPAGILIPGVNTSPEYRENFTRCVTKVLTDAEVWRHYRDLSLEKAKQYSWDGIADEWLDLVGLPK